MTKKKIETSIEDPVAEAQAKYLRALADYQNLEKRMNTAVEQARQQSKKDVIGRFIGVLDDLEKAEVFIHDAGLKMIADKFTQILNEAGVKEIELLGAEYDPYVAEAIEVVPAEDGQKANVVVEVVRKGYKIGESIIRPAQVKVTHITN